MKSNCDADANSATNSPYRSIIPERIGTAAVIAGFSAAIAVSVLDSLYWKLGMRDFAYYFGIIPAFGVPIIGSLILATKLINVVFGGTFDELGPLKALQLSTDSSQRIKNVIKTVYVGWLMVGGLLGSYLSLFGVAIVLRWITSL
jgi:hypothetical protein